MNTTLAYCRFARAFLAWVWNAGWISHREFRALRRAINRLERQTIGCAGKYRFDSFVDALRAADRRGRGLRTKRPYHCPACRGFHVAGADRGARMRRLQLQHRIEEELADA